MIVRKVIHEELGQDLEKIGFKFVPGERMFWPYEREKDGVKQEIVIERERYIKNAIRVMFSTNAYGTGGKEFMDFVPEEGVKHRFWWVYENEEELREILREFKRLIFAYGLELLESISKPTTDAIPTAEKNRYLYEHHQELFEEYEKKLGTKGKKTEEALEIIHEAMVETLDEPFSEVEDMLVGLAALYGHTICWGDRGEWAWKDDKMCMLKGILGTPVNEYVLLTVINSWDYMRERRDRKPDNALLRKYKKNILRHYYIAHPEETPMEEKKIYLYEHHQELYEEYEEKLGTKGKRPEEVIDIIYEEIGEILNIPFAKVIDTLIGISALYGHTICGVNGWKWSWNDESRECVIKQVSEKAKEENMLRTIIFSWDSWRKNRKQRKEENPLFKAYEDIIKLNRESGE